MNKPGMIIDGKRVASSKAFDLINPYTGEKVASVPIAEPQQIERALKLSYETKMVLTAKQRAGILKSIAVMLKKNKRKIAELITLESGLSLKDTLREVERAMDVAFFSSEVAQEIEKDTTCDYLFSRKKNRLPRLKVITEPLDLVVGITPFNHPLNQVAHKVFPAIAAGTCMVLKPSGKTPLSALKLGELLLKAGL